MSRKILLNEKIQTYLKYPSGKMYKLGKPISEQRAIEMAREFGRSESKCIRGGTVKLSIELKETKRGKLVFELPYGQFVNFSCDVCLGACVTIPMGAECKLKICREYLRHGMCKDPVISSIIGCGVYPKKYSKTR